jgi:hypothetical protein
VRGPATRSAGAVGAPAAAAPYFTRRRAPPQRTRRRGRQLHGTGTRRGLTGEGAPRSARRGRAPRRRGAVDADLGGPRHAAVPHLPAGDLEAWPPGCLLEFGDLEAAPVEMPTRRAEPRRGRCPPPFPAGWPASTRAAAQELNAASSSSIGPASLHATPDALPSSAPARGSARDWVGRGGERRREQERRNGRGARGRVGSKKRKKLLEWAHVVVVCMEYEI